MAALFIPNGSRDDALGRAPRVTLAELRRGNDQLPSVMDPSGPSGAGGAAWVIESRACQKG